MTGVKPQFGASLAAEEKDGAQRDEFALHALSTEPQSVRFLVDSARCVGAVERVEIGLLAEAVVVLKEQVAVQDIAVALDLYTGPFDIRCQYREVFQQYRANQSQMNHNNACAPFLAFGGDDDDVVCLVFRDSACAPYPHHDGGSYKVEHTCGVASPYDYAVVSPVVFENGKSLQDLQSTFCSFL